MGRGKCEIGRNGAVGERREWSVREEGIRVRGEGREIGGGEKRERRRGLNLGVRKLF